MNQTTISNITVQKYSGIGKIDAEIKFRFTDNKSIIANINGNTVKFYVISETHRAKIYQILLLFILHGITINEIIMEYVNNDFY